MMQTPIAASRGIGPVEVLSPDRDTTDKLSGCCAAILAGGLGTRLRSVVPDRPKILAPIGGRPYILFLLDQLAQIGLQSVVLCTGYAGDQVRVQLGNRYRELRLQYSQETLPLGTAGALRLALPHLPSSRVLVLNGDSYVNVDLAAFNRHHDRNRARASMVVAYVNNAARFGTVQLAADDRVTGFEEKKTTQQPGWINAGVYLLERELIERIADAGAVSLEREMFPLWIGEGLFGFRCTGAFLDIGTPESYAAAEAFFASS
jgi:NDP-sugar pyrophosphorylase family protein